MALVIGTNCGFVLAAPTGDPGGGLEVVADAAAHAWKVTSPTGVNLVTEMGWYCATESEASNFQVGIYSHDSDNNRPLTLLASSGDIAKGTTTGWKTADVLCDIEAETIYWLGLQVDNTTASTKVDATSTVGQLDRYKLYQTSLPFSWGATDGFDAWLVALYAVYTAAGSTMTQAIASSAAIIAMTKGTSRL